MESTNNTKTDTQQTASESVPLTESFEETAKRLIAMKCEIDTKLTNLQMDMLVERFGVDAGDIIEIDCIYNNLLRGKKLKIVKISATFSHASYVVTPQNKDGSWSRKQQTLFLAKESIIKHVN